jgi:hypothetical protein
MNVFRVIPLLFPMLIDALVALRLPFLGRILSLFQHPIDDTQALQELNRAQNWRPKRKTGFNDSAHVIKVSDAIACVQTQVNNRLHWLAVAKEVVKSLVGTPGNSMAGLGDDVAECLREKALTQLTERIRRDTKTKLHRPALGHGKGRTHFG